MSLFPVFETKKRHLAVFETKKRHPDVSFSFQKQEKEIIIVNNYGKIEVRHTHGVDRPDGARNPGRDVRALATFKNPSQGD